MATLAEAYEACIKAFSAYKARNEALEVYNKARLDTKE